MTKATGLETMHPAAFLHAVLQRARLGRAVNRRGARGDFWSGMRASRFDRSDTAGY